VPEHVAEIVVGVGMIGIECQGALELRRGHFVVALGHEGIAQIVVVVGIAPSKPDRAADQFDGIAKTPGPMGDQAETMQTVGMPGVGRQDQAEKPFALGQPTGATVPHGLIEQSLAVRDLRSSLTPHCPALSTVTQKSLGVSV
ncbi:MAG TPA: hypothetical protein VMU42_16315, partial [Candidatus Sulfotelmatobacter sp.]|nr:hypothetical protein [Candidatus Sulfotelmatobacter sp.]